MKGPPTEKSLLRNPSWDKCSQDSQTLSLVNLNPGHLVEISAMETGPVGRADGDAQILSAPVVKCSEESLSRENRVQEECEIREGRQPQELRWVG